MRIARAFVGHRETAPNRSPWVDYWNRRVGAPLGSPWCAAFVAFVLDSARVSYPTVRSAAARAYITARSVPASMALSAARRGWLVIWRRGSSGWQGHIGILVRSTAERFTTIEGNTALRAGTEWDGDGVALRTREWRTALVGAFRVTHITPVE